MFAFEHVAPVPADHADRVRWNAKYEVGSRPRSAVPAQLLEAVCALRPPPGDALDLAAGSGLAAVDLAFRGYRVVAADVSDVAARLCGAEASRRGVAVEYVIADLCASRLARACVDLVVCRGFLARSLCAQIPAALRPGGALYFEAFTLDHLRHVPSFPETYCLSPGELATLFPGLEIVRSDRVDDGERAYAQLLARKSPLLDFT